MIDETESIATVRAMLALWNDLDWAGIRRSLHDECVYQEMMHDPITGRDKIMDYILETVSTAESLTIEIRCICEAEGTVCVERYDTWVHKGNPGGLPVMAAFRVQDGLISEWREYFDWNALISQLA